VDGERARHGGGSARTPSRACDRRGHRNLSNDCPQRRDGTELLWPFDGSGRAEPNRILGTAAVCVLDPHRGGFEERAGSACSGEQSVLFQGKVRMNDFSANDADTIVLVHGLWVNPRSWEGWKHHFEARGYRVLTPAWPGLDREVEDLRRDPSGIAGVGLLEVADHYENIIRALDRPPIIMGHSFGGTVVQLLLDRGWAASASPSTPQPSRASFRCRCRPSSRPSRSSATRPTRTRRSR
jgi:pimeloyl-ACP methyl ester carboxylesterase